MKAAVIGMRGTTGVAATDSARADAIIDLSISHLRDGLRNSIREIASKHGADAGVDSIGGDTNAAALGACRT